MTDPEIVAERLSGNMDAFMKTHRADIAAMCISLDLDVDLIIMDMVMAGYEEIRTRAMQMMAAGKFDELVKSVKEQMEGMK